MFWHATTTQIVPKTMNRPELRSRLSDLSLQRLQSAWPERPVTTFTGDGVKLLIDDREVVWLSRDGWKIKFDGSVPDAVIIGSINALMVGV